MKMRELESRTGVNRETIRVLFREGLLPEPSRPARNVADYGEEHVRAILAVRKLQQDSAMTLPQIKSLLNGKSAGRPMGAQAFAHLEQLVASRVGVETGMINLAIITARYPKAEADALTLDRLGIVELVKTPNGLQLSVTDAGLVNLWGKMRAAGFDEERGFPPDILDYYTNAAEYVAENEARLFLERVEGKIDENEAATMLEFALPAMLDFFGILRQKAFLRKIGEKTRGQKDAASQRKKRANRLGDPIVSAAGRLSTLPEPQH